MILLLEIKNITFAFDNGKPLFTNFSLSLEQGKIYTLMGANGSGKTTLFNIISGFYKPIKGQIQFKAIDITRLFPYKVNRCGIGRTFQDLRLITKLTVIENILLAISENPTDKWYKALLSQSFYKKETNFLKTKAESIADQYFLSDMKDRLAEEISYGQQKLLTLACCVANDSELLLLDEPLAGINPEYRKRIIELIANLKSAGKTVLVIEHHIESMEKISDRIFFLSNGGVSTYNNYEQLRSDPVVLNAYL